MSDITYQDLLKAKTGNADTTEENLMGMANVALKILEQVSILKGQGGNVMASRPAQAQTDSQKPKGITVEQISETLSTVKSLKGDIKISELQKLLKEHGDQIGILLGKLS